MLKKHRGIILFLMIMGLLLSTQIPMLGSKIANAATAQNIIVGNYIKMGLYNNTPIIWRCVDIDETKGPLFLADKIIAIKPYDAKGIHPNDPTNDRLNLGSNLWETSNIRAWLNSKAATVIWPCGIAPTSSGVLSGINSYSAEKGFLADGNFLQTERNLMSSVVQKTILSDNDKSLALGGTGYHTYDTSILSSLQNYDNSYYNNVEDKVFLLDVKQLNKVYQNGPALGASYYIGQPTASAVSTSTYKDANFLTEKKNWIYALRTPSADDNSSGSVRSVSAEGLISENDAYCSYLGIRPAFYMNKSSQIIQSGAGTDILPYVIASTDCDVISSQTPSSATIGANTISASLPPATTKSLTVALTVSLNSKWKLYSDAACIDEITSKIMTLGIGVNTAYVKVTAEDGVTTKIYTIILTPSSACNIVSVQTPTNATILDNTITASLSYATDTLQVKVTPSTNATWKIYSDSLCTNEIIYNIMSINIGANIAYVKVTAQDAITTRIYTLTITSVKSSACDVTKSLTPVVSATQIVVNRIPANLPFSTENLTVSVETSPYSTWKLYSDIYCTSEITSKNINLNVGLNVFYIKVTAQDGITTKVYSLIITRAMRSSECKVLSATTPVVTYIGSSTIVGSVKYSTTSIVVDVTTSIGATWDLYTDIDCNSEIINKNMDLAVNENTAYIKVTAQDETSTKVYKLIVVRAEPSNSCDVINSKVPLGATILSNIIMAGVPISPSKIIVDVTVSLNATWKIYSDAACLVPIVSYMNLPNAENTAYIKVTAEDKITTKTYTLIVSRLSTACDIVSVSIPAGASIDGNIITAGVIPETTSIAVSVVASINSAWNLYSDLSCTTILTDKIMNLNMGSNVAYIRVVAQDGVTTKTYTLNVIRGIIIGDYVVMGNYYNEPIVWRCVDIDSNGPLMLADKIISLKPYDAKGVHPNDTNNDRLNYGSNLWETSNMRAWLNSTADENNLVWPCGNAPTIANVWNGYNAYASEKGFLADGNFTITERNLVKSVTQKSILNENDKSTKAGGTEIHANITTLTSDLTKNVLQNFDKAYYQNVADKMFLLDVKQLNNVWENCSTILGASYYIGQPTAKAVENSQYKSTYLLEGNNWYYWLRTPDATSTNNSGVRYVYSDGLVYSSTTFVQNLLGVRPAFYMNIASGTFESGNGSVATPYVPAPAPTMIDYKGSSLGDPTNVVFPQEGGQHDLLVTYQNNTNKIQNTVFVVAVKKDNKLISIYPINKTFELSEEFTFSHSIDIPSTTDSTNVEVDFFLWDEFATMKPKHDTVKNSINNVR